MDSGQAVGAPTLKTGRVWALAFVAGLIAFSVLSLAIFPAKEGGRDSADWLLVIIFPLLISATMATFVSLFLAPQGKQSPKSDSSAPPVTNRMAEIHADSRRLAAASDQSGMRAPFADWLAREWSTSGCGSLSVALNTYIRTFDLRKPGRADEPTEVTDYRLKLAILKGSLVSHPKWKDTPELMEYIEDLESLLEVFAFVPSSEAKPPEISLGFGGHKSKMATPSA